MGFSLGQLKKPSGRGDAEQQPSGGRTGGSPPLAIDFGVSALKILQVSGGDVPALVGAAQVRTPEELLTEPAKRLKFQIEQLPKLLKKGKFKTKRAVALLPVGQTYCKHLQLVRAEGVPLDAIIQATLPDQLGCAADEVLIRHIDVGDVGRGGKSEVICFAASRQLVTRVMTAMKACGLTPVGVHTEFHALAGTFADLNRREEDQSRTTLYLDIGYGSTKILIMHGPKIVFARSVDFGGLAMDEAVMRQLKYTLADSHAERLNWTALTDEHAPAESSEPEGMAMLAAGMSKAGAAAGSRSVEGTGGGGAGGEEIQIFDSPGGVGEGGGDEGPDAGDAGGDGSAPAKRGLFGRRGAGVGGGDRRESETPPGQTPLTPAQHTARDFVRPTADLTEALEILTDEVSMSLRYHRSLFPSRPVESVVFVGGETRQRSLCEHIARRLRLTAQVADPLARLARSGKEPTPGLDLNESQPGFAAPLGACLAPTDL